MSVSRAKNIEFNRKRDFPRCISLYILDLTVNIAAYCRVLVPWCWCWDDSQRPDRQERTHRHERHPQHHPHQRGPTHVCNRWVIVDRFYKLIEGFLFHFLTKFSHFLIFPDISAPTNSHLASNPSSMRMVSPLTWRSTHVRQSIH